MGEFLFHIDSDIHLVDTTTIEKCVKLCDSGADAVFIPQVFKGENFWGKCREAEFKTYLDYSPLTSARFVRRKALLVVGGYDEDLISGEDWDIAEKLKRGSFEIATASTLVVHGSGTLDLLNRLRKCYNYGKTVTLYARKYPRETVVQWGPSRFTHLLLGAKNLAPKYVFGIMLLKSLEFGSGFAGIISGIAGQQRRQSKRGA